MQGVIMSRSPYPFTRTKPEDQIREEERER
jgi:hypothetical protein